MAKPLVVDLPHRLGAEEARRRIAGGMGRLTDHLPAGAQVRSHWEGNCLDLSVTALGQEANARIEVGERIVRVEMVLPQILSFFGGRIEKLVRSKGTDLLEDHSGGKA